MNLKRIDLNLLVSLDALLTERNVTRAAQRLSLTQSAVSTQLARLRDVFEDPLFVPQARGIIPTPRALALMEPLKKVLADLEVLVQHGPEFDPATDHSTIKIATTGYIHFTLCVPLAKLMREQAPQMRLALLQLNNATAAAQLEQSDLDLVITNEVGLMPGWKSRQVMRESFVTVLSKRHPAAKRAMTLDRFCALDHLLVAPASAGFQGTVDEILQAQGRKRNVAMSVQNFMVVPYILDATDLISTLPSQLTRSFSGTLKVIKPPVEIPEFTMHAAWHPRSQSDPVHQWVRRKIEEIGAGISR